MKKKPITQLERSVIIKCVAEYPTNITYALRLATFELQTLHKVNVPFSRAYNLWYAKGGLRETEDVFKIISINGKPLRNVKNQTSEDIEGYGKGT